MTTVFDVLRVLMENGWRLAFHFGNHLEFRHHAKPGPKMIVRGGLPTKSCLSTTRHSCSTRASGRTRKERPDELIP